MEDYILTIYDPDGNPIPIPAIQGIGIKEINLKDEAQDKDTYEIVLDDDRTYHFIVKHGIIPHIGDNGNWWVGEVDTNMKAQGKDGNSGVYIGPEETMPAGTRVRVDPEGEEIDFSSLEGEYRLLKTITVTEPTQRISESWGTMTDGKGYDGVVVLFDDIAGIENTNGLTIYASIGSPQTVTGVGAALKNNQVLRLVARKLNGLWDIFGSYGTKDGASTLLGQTGCANLYSTAPHNATPDGYRFSWDKISRALFYTFAESLPIGMTIKIFVLRGETE